MDKWSIVDIDQTQSGEDRFISSFEPFKDSEDPNALALILPNIVSQRPTTTMVNFNLEGGSTKSYTDFPTKAYPKATTDNTDAIFPLFSSPSSGSAFIRDQVSTTTSRSIPTSNYFPAVPKSSTENFDYTILEETSSILPVSIPILVNKTCSERLKAKCSIVSSVLLKVNHIKSKMTF